MQKRLNRRGYTEQFVKQQHLNITKLKKEISLENAYLQKEIPEYPKPEFHVSLLKHETNGMGVKGIKEDGGFKDKYGTSLIYWSLAVGPEEINNAETRLLEKTIPDRMEVEDTKEQRFLWKFATSPAFKETSRLGSFRFTFPLEEVLTAYKDQICSGAELVMRVYETILYKQEVMYTVLVHSPDFNEKFSGYPLLNDDLKAVCAYRDGHFIWRSEAMCETHWYELDQMEAKCLERHEFYVWDNFALVLHMENEQQVLKFDDNELQKNLKYCEKDDVPIESNFHDLDEAETLVKKLWPNRSSPLKVARPLQMSYPVTELTLVLVGSDGKEARSFESALQRECYFSPSVRLSNYMKVDNLKIELIHTPDLSELDNAEEKKKTLKRIRLSGPAPQVFLLVIGLKNINADQIKTTITNFESIFQNRALRRTIILFTHQEKVKPDIQEILEKVEKFLIQKVCNRYHVFNHNPGHQDPQNVSDLVKKVKEMIEGSD